MVDHDDDGRVATIALRYQYVGHLDPIVYRVLGTRTLTWVQTLVLDRTDRAGRLDVAVEATPPRLRGAVVFAFTDDDGTLRRSEGEVTVNVPLVGGQAERRIVPGFLRRLDIEAEYLARRLAS